MMNSPSAYRLHRSADSIFGMLCNIGTTPAVGAVGVRCQVSFLSFNYIWDNESLGLWWIFNQCEL